MDRSQGPSNKHIVFLFMGFLVLFILVFALGVIVGKGLSDSSLKLSDNAVNKPIVGIQQDDKTEDTYIADAPDENKAELEDILDEVKSDEIQDTNLIDIDETDNNILQGQEVDKSEGKDIVISSGSNINLKVEKPEVKNQENKVSIASSGTLPTIDPNGQYTVQIGSFKNEADAIKLQNKLKSNGYPAFIKQANIGQETWFRLRVGTFANKDQAKLYGDILLKKESGTVQSVYVTPNL